MKYFSSLVWVVCENHGFSQVKDLPSHKMLAAQGAVLTNYFSVTHPSGPNYRSMGAGNFWTKDELLHEVHPTVASHTGVPTTVCNFKGPPAARHNPFHDLGDQVVTVDTLDLEGLPESAILYVGLDDQNNAHSGPLATADRNLVDLLQRLGQSAWFNRPVGDLYPALFVVWDESYLPGNQVFAAIFGKGVRQGATCADKLDHFSFCRLVCDNWDKPPLEQAAAAASIEGIWV